MVELGANLPWLDYGQDFGASAWRPDGGVAHPERRERLRRELGRLAESGARLVRLWLLGDGRAGLREDAAGPLGLDDHFMGDLDAALLALEEAGLGGVLVLMDYLWFAPARKDGGVQRGGRRNTVREPSARARLLETVFAPIARHCAPSRAVWAFDLINEPEWATLGAGSRDPRRALSRREMRRFLSELADCLHARAAQPLCVGLASRRWRSLLEGIALDFEQFHWYESLESATALSAPVAPKTSGQRAPLLGEFPTRGASLSPERIFELAAGAGYSGALAWSSLATDTATDGEACHAALRAAAGQRLAGGTPPPDSPA